MKTLYKDSFKEIKNSKKRFISIILIVLLGVGFFCGIKATSPDMRNTLNNYVNSKNLFDIEIISTLGLTAENIENIKKVDKVNNVVGSISFDALVNIGNEEMVFKVHSFDGDINKLELISGKYPENINEVVIEKDFFDKENYKIGDEITIELDDENISLKNKRVKIVGIVNSPLYVSMTRGNSALGSGTINYYMYINIDNIESDYYTEVYMNVLNPRNYASYTNSYDKLVDNVMDELNDLGLIESATRYNELVMEANDKISDAESELKDAKNKLASETKKARQEIKDAKTKIAEAKEKLETLKITSTNYEQIKNKIKSNNESITTLIMEISTLTDPNVISEKQIDLYALQYENSILEQNKTLIETELTKEGIDYNNLDKFIKDSEDEISASLEKINASEMKLASETKKANNKIADAEVELEDAKLKVTDIKEGKWYVLDRKSNVGFASYLQDADRIEKIGVLFPVVFFVVAALVCLTSMTRMVDEQRLEIGTLKSLGYNKASIAFKYILYALMASLIGSVLGMIIGFNTIPSLIGNIYQMMYTLPDLESDFVWYYALLGLIVALISTVGATIYSYLKSLREKPAELLRGKAPEAGKRVFLEKIKFIWKRLKFTQKVTVRNMFRYKKRFYMTIIGILGCTSLITAGFGLRDSISNLIPNQYSNIFKYDAFASIKSDYEKINEIVLNTSGVTNTLGLLEESVEITSIENNQSIILMVPNTTDYFDDFISLHSLKGAKYELNDNGVIITDKISRLLDIKVGDVITIKNNDDEEAQVKVSGIAENCVMHYIYMTKSLYQTLFTKEYQVNNIYILANITNENEFTKSILESNKNITTVKLLDSTMDFYSKIMDNMEMVAYILVISAGLLAFVVLFNLANVNISERKREIATIKVLGFFDKEVYKYITREIYLLVLIGIPLGLLGGYILTTYVVKTCELDMVTFKTAIKPTSYLIAIVLTFVFTVIVNIMTNFILKKIDMIESLKSIE